MTESAHPSEPYLAALGVRSVTPVSGLTYRGAARHSITSTIVQFKAEEWIAVASEQPGLSDLEIALRSTTAYEGDPEALRPGTRMTVWWKSVGERRFVADKVRLLSVAATR